MSCDQDECWNGRDGSVTLPSNDPTDQDPPVSDQDQPGGSSCDQDSCADQTLPGGGCDQDGGCTPDPEPVLDNGRAWLEQFDFDSIATALQMAADSLPLMGLL